MNRARLLALFIMVALLLMGVARARTAYADDPTASGGCATYTDTVQLKSSSSNTPSDVAATINSTTATIDTTMCASSSADPNMPHGATPSDPPPGRYRGDGVGGTLWWVGCAMNRSAQVWGRVSIGDGEGDFAGSMIVNNQYYSIDAIAPPRVCGAPLGCSFTSGVHRIWNVNWSLFQFDYLWWANATGGGCF